MSQNAADDFARIGAELKRIEGQSEPDIWLNTAPCEMPPVQPSFVAPESDPA
jgi:hypothetical protein